MTASAEPLVVAVGDTLRSDSSTEHALRHCLASVERQGGRTQLFTGADIDLPMYNSHEPARTPRAVQLIGALRAADAVVVGSPGYHGGVSGLVKNALDYIKDMREDSRVYLDNKPWGCISCAYGWQGQSARWGNFASSGMRCGPGQLRSGWRSTLWTRSGMPAGKSSIPWSATNWTCWRARYWPSPAHTA